MIKVYNGKQRGLGEEPKSGGWLQLGFEFRDMLHHFKSAKLAVFMAIVLHSDEEGVSFPSYDTLCRETGYGRDTIARALDELCETTIEDSHILIRWRKRDDKGKFTGSNHYLIFPSKDELHNQQKPTMDNANYGKSSLEVEPKNKVKPKRKEEPVVQPPPADETPIPEDIYFLYQHILGQMVNSSGEAELLADIEATYPLDWIKDAMIEAVRNNVRKLAYFDSILKRWQKDGRNDTRPTNGKYAKIAPPTDSDYEASAAENEEYEQPKRRPSPLSTQQHVFANGLTDSEAWHIAVEELSHQLSPDVHHRALGLSRFIEYDNGYVIRAESAKIKEVLEKRLNTKVSSALERAAGESVAIRYVVAGE